MTDVVKLDTIRAAAAHAERFGGALTVEHEGRRVVVRYRSLDGRTGGKWIGFKDDGAAWAAIARATRKRRDAA